MRILHVLPRYAPYVGGSETFFQAISERLAAEGHQVTFYTTDAWDLEHFWRSGRKTIAAGRETLNGVDVVRFPVRRLPAAPLAYPVLRRVMAGLSDLPRIPLQTSVLEKTGLFTPYVPGLARAMRDHVARRDFDIVHTGNAPLDGLIVPTVAYARRARRPFLFTPFVHIGQEDDPRVRRYYTMRHQVGWMRDARSVIAMTGREREYMVRLGVPREKIVVTGAGVDPAFGAGGNRQRMRARLGLSDADKMVLFQGTAAYDKGAMPLADAVRDLRAAGYAPEGGQLRLVFAGPSLTQFDSYYAALPKAARHDISVLGFVSDDDKRDLFAACDIFAMPSRTDSFGIVYLEAWLYGKPVIGADAGGVPDVIDDADKPGNDGGATGGDGFTPPFGDVPALARIIRRLCDSPDLACTLGARGKEKVLAAMTWDHVYARIRPLYGEG